MLLLLTIICNANIDGASRYHELVDTASPLETIYYAYIIRPAADQILA